MTVTVKEFLLETSIAKQLGGAVVRPRVVCADGFSVSIQHSVNHYCSPKQNFPAQIETVELGFPSAPVPEWLPFAEDPTDPTDTIYSFVPLDVVEEVINRHGGIASIM